VGVFNVIASFVSGLLGPIVQWAQRRQELAAAKQAADDEYKLQELKNQDSDNIASGKRVAAQLKAYAAWFRYVMVGIYMYPFVMVQFSKEQAITAIANMNALPPGYNESVALIIFAIVGIPVGAGMAQSVFGSLTGYFQGKREAAYNHEQTVVQLKLNREAVISDLTASLGGKMDQRTIDMVHKAINAGDDDPSNDGTTRS
jgi:hypothetical protein